MFVDVMSVYIAYSCSLKVYKIHEFMRILTYLNTSDFVNHVDQTSSINKYNTASAIPH